MQRKTAVSLVWLLVFLLTAGFSSSINARESGGGLTSQAAQSIKVHGHWIIEIRNPDGGLVRRWEFENDLTSNGPVILSGLLSRSSVAGGWQIGLGSGTSTDPCGTDAAPARCFIAEASSTSTSPDFFKNLTVGRTVDSKLLLTGNATARRNGSIPRVMTLVQVCPAQGCSPAFGFQSFTSTDLSSAISVVAGQQIQVTVEISFS